MLENIKFILGITSNEHDPLIMFYIKRVEALVLDYCNLELLNPVLEGFVEDKVISVVGPKVKPSNEIDTPNNNIKAISRGDTKIEYNVSETKSDELGEASLTGNDIKILNRHRKLRK